jgi:hypothetical protein
MTTLATRVEKKKESSKIRKTETQTSLAHAEKAQAEKSIQGEKSKVKLKPKQNARHAPFHCGRLHPPWAIGTDKRDSCHMANGVLPKTMQAPITSLFFFVTIRDSIIDSGVYFRRGAKRRES